MIDLHYKFVVVCDLRVRVRVPRRNMYLLFSYSVVEFALRNLLSLLQALILWGASFSVSWEIECHLFGPNKSSIACESISGEVSCRVGD